MKNTRPRVAPSRAGVRRIFLVEPSSLPSHLMLSAICGGESVTFIDSCSEIQFSGKPLFTREGTLLNNARAEKSTLEFRSDFRIPDDRRVAFLVEQVNGKCFLIGTREPNYPVVEYSDTSGDPAGDPAIRTYKITHTDIRSGLPVLI